MKIKKFKKNKNYIKHKKIKFHSQFDYWDFVFSNCKRIERVEPQCCPGTDPVVCERFAEYKFYF